MPANLPKSVPANRFPVVPANVPANFPANFSSFPAVFPVKLVGALPPKLVGAKCPPYRNPLSGRAFSDPCVDTLPPHPPSKKPQKTRYRETGSGTNRLGVARPGGVIVAFLGVAWESLTMPKAQASHPKPTPANRQQANPPKSPQKKPLQDGPMGSRSLTSVLAFRRIFGEIYAVLCNFHIPFFFLGGWGGLPIANYGICKKKTIIRYRQPSCKHSIMSMQRHSRQQCCCGNPWRYLAPKERLAQMQVDRALPTGCPPSGQCSLWDPIQLLGNIGL